MMMTVADTDDRLYLNDGFGPTTWETDKALEKARTQYGRKIGLPKVEAKFVHPNLEFKPRFFDTRESYTLLIAHGYLPAESTDFLNDCAIAEVTSRKYGCFTAYDIALIDSKFQSYIDFPASSFNIIPGVVLPPNLPRVIAAIDSPKDMDEVNSFRPDKMKAEHVAARRVVLRNNWSVGLYVFDQRLYVSAEWDLTNSGLVSTLETSELIQPE